jgi:RNA polymerase sigma-70 factor (ECF subfamily)
MTPAPSTSTSFLARLSAADPGAWARLAAVYTPLMHAWLRPRGLQPADVDDLTQAALAVVLRRVPEFRHNGRRGAFRAWLRAIVTNAVRDHRRAAARRPAGDPDPLADLEDPDGDLAQWWDAEHDRYVLRGLMALVRQEFTDATWEAFRRTALDGRPAAEVAAELGTTPNAVHIARSRVTARLRREAEGFLDDLL